MNEFRFKFIYNGENSFLNLLDNIRFNTKTDSIGRYWKGVIRVDEKIYMKSEGCYITVILLKIIEKLGDKKGVSIEMNLYS